MSAYPRSASQFLASTFAPFGGGGGRDAVDQAPLFFSTVDGESVGEVDDDGEVGRSRYYYHDDEDNAEDNIMRGHPASSSSSPASHHAELHQRHDAYHQHQPHQARDGLQPQHEHMAGTSTSSIRSDHDPYSHDGLGRSPSEVGSDESNDPFRSHGTRSRQSIATYSAPSRKQAQQSAPNAGWRMHATNLLPGVQQSVLHNLYEQSESVYSSVFIGKKLDKGKQKATEDDELHPFNEQTSSNSPSQPPAYLASAQPLALPLHQPASKQQGQHNFSRPEHVHTSHADNYSQQSRIHRYPMPTSRYRRAASGAKDTSLTAADMEWQDQSYRDPAWLAIYLFNVLFTVLLSLYLLLFDSTRKPSSTHLIAPSMAILRSIPLLSLLVFASLLITTSALAYTLLIKNGARQAAFVFVLAPPVIFLLGSGWAFEASFALEFAASGDIQVNASWAQTTLRTTSMCLLICSAFAFRRSWQTLFSSGSSSRRARLERTIRVLQVSAEVVIQHPQLIFLAVALVGAYIISSVPAILIIAQLLYHGTIKQTSNSELKDGYTYLIPSTWSIILSLHTALVYFWSLGLLRAVYQHTIAGTVGSWWYNDKLRKSSTKERDRNDNDIKLAVEAQKPKITMLQAQQNVLDAFHRAVGPSIGTLCASSLILAMLSLFTLLISFSYNLVNRSRRWTGPNLAATAIRIFVNFVILPLIAILSGLIRNLNAFTLVHSAITGDTFWDASGEAADLIMGRNGTGMVASREFLFVRALEPVIGTRH